MDQNIFFPTQEIQKNYVKVEVAENYANSIWAF